MKSERRKSSATMAFPRLTSFKTVCPQALLSARKSTILNCSDHVTEARGNASRDAFGGGILKNGGGREGSTFPLQIEIRGAKLHFMSTASSFGDK